ncbi:RNA polymerase factor sigma-54 [Motiliproteus sp. MSK22-1]|uniref:RNA polymerase factor sigma-54 n=1 Tax=Motiliproteus sp. MSK22-1 TaxID=1897630 RepID=UPI000977A7B6|nr:RNA polymerase factor sigma-54 [Motiliproteus sp. MSK22-1]OMH30365.1 RNA polymerase factor sigma-54 [Motiliproteus sp. MSK22-1]
MKPTLQLKISQQLTMTPQLQQAIRLLQLSTLDLQQEIQQALDSNPMLETSEEDVSNTDTATTEQHNGAELASEQPTVSSNETEGAVADSEWNEQIPVELSTDSSWDDTYQSSTPTSSSSTADGSSMDFESADHHSETLNDHLEWQLNLTPMSDIDRLIAMSIIDGIDIDGYLRTDLEDIVKNLNDNLKLGNESGDNKIIQELEVETDEELSVELDEVEAVLRRIQQFDPPGIACRDLRECLLIQLNQLPSDTQWINEAKQLVDKHLALLGNHDYKQLMRRCKLKEPQLKSVVALIQQLNPRPGNMIDFGDVEYVIPDVFVKKEKDSWTVRLNSDAAPKIRINDNYANLVRRADNSPDNTYLRNHLQEARWFLKSLLSRNETLLKVAIKIVEHQQDFLEYGEEAMKPLVLHDIAEAVEMHESTISRVTTQKFMHTPRGIFELKYFFSSHVSTASGGECSSTAIRAIIKKLVAAENLAKPLSDSKIANLLEEQGIKVARRTIAKYREALSIPPSNERKRLV